MIGHQLEGRGTGIGDALLDIKFRIINQKRRMSSVLTPRFQRKLFNC